MSSDSSPPPFSSSGVEGRAPPFSPSGVEGRAPPFSSSGVEGRAPPFSPSGVGGRAPPFSPSGVEAAPPFSPSGVEAAPPFSPSGVGGRAPPFSPSEVEGRAPSPPFSPSGVEGRASSPPFSPSEVEGRALSPPFSPSGVEGRASSPPFSPSEVEGRAPSSFDSPPLGERVASSPFDPAQGERVASSPFDSDQGKRGALSPSHFPQGERGAPPLSHFPRVSRRQLWLGVFLCVLLAPARAQAAQGDLHRFALLAGNDEGSAETRPLLYAREDAKKLHDILLRLGGVRPEDATLLLNARADELLAALGAMERRVQDAQRHGERTALFVYYSGHAKDGALLMSGSQLPFVSLKSRLLQSPADVRIAVLDACRAGALTRTKGVRRAPAFEIDATPKQDAHGLVILTSSASDEDSQESDDLGGSYFSHHLASGLMGDADSSGDGRVSLSEAYAYAYDRTVADTADSAAGAQHPTFSYELAGNGDVVMTDLGRPDGVLLPAEVSPGTYYLVDSRGLIAAEVFKPAGTPRKLALAPGRYRVKKRLADRLRVGELTVIAGQTVALDERMLHDAPFSDDPVKGVHVNLSALRWSVGPSAQYQYFFDAPARNGFFPPTALVGAEVGLANFFRRNWDIGADVAYGSARSLPDVGNTLGGLSFQSRELTVGASLLVRFPIGAFTPFLGGRIAFVSLHRDFGSDLRDGSQDLATFTPGAFGGVSYTFLRAFTVTVRGRVHYLIYRADGNASLGYTELGGGLSYSWESQP